MPSPATAAAIAPSLALTFNRPLTWKEVAPSADPHQFLMVKVNAGSCNGEFDGAAAVRRRRQFLMA